MNAEAPTQTEQRGPAGGAPGVQTGGNRRTFALGDEQRQFDFEVLEIARVVRVVKGGRRFSFRASVIVGNRSGTVGVGVGKSKDVQTAINKAYDQGAKSVVTVPVAGGTVPHEVAAKYSGSRVMLRPARPGTGVVAGGTVRLIAELVGLNDVVTKRHGSANKVNTARATLAALSSLRTRRKQK